MTTPHPAYEPAIRLANLLDGTNPVSLETAFAYLDETIEKLNLGRRFSSPPSEKLPNVYDETGIRYRVIIDKNNPISIGTFYDEYTDDTSLSMRITLLIDKASTRAKR